MFGPLGTGTPIVVQRLLWIFVPAAFTVACTPFFDTEPSGEIVDIEANACGGGAELVFDGEVARPGDPCGVCPGEGHLACNGVDALRCVGATLPNACGGCIPLDGDPFEPCGVCDGAGAGYFVCDGDNALECVTEAGYSACGGCSPLEGQPGQPCSADDPTATWTCASRNSVACISGGPNLCGGDAVLEFDGIVSPAPGLACDGACEPSGVLRCASADSVVCEDAGDTNVCGGCGALPGEVGDECGPCGRRICDDGQMFCVNPEPNACGGCEDLPASPGEACDGGTIVCNGSDAVICVPQSDDTNACGGLGDLDAAPGSTCGECNSGIWVCDGTSSVVCAGDLGPAARNGCGGCDPLPAGPGDQCGECGSGMFECDPADDNRLVCAGNQGPEARNECGGCAFLWGEPGEPCGECFRWQCSNTDEDAVTCVWAGDEPGGCDGDSCEACEEAFRECTDEGCGDCLDGYVDVGGDCVEDGLPCDETCVDGEPVLTGECVRINTDTCVSAGRGPGTYEAADCPDGICQFESVETSVACEVEVIGLPCRWADDLSGVCTAGGECILPNVVYRVSPVSRAAEVTSPACPDAFQLVGGGCVDELGTWFVSSSPTNVRPDDASGDLIFDESWTCRWPDASAPTPRNAVGVCVRETIVRDRWFAGTLAGSITPDDESPACRGGFALGGGCTALDGGGFVELHPNLGGDLTAGERAAPEDGTWRCRPQESGDIAIGGLCGFPADRRVTYSVSDATSNETVDADCGPGVLIGGGCLSDISRPIFGSHPFPLLGPDPVWRCSAEVEGRRTVRAVAVCLSR